MNLGSDTTFLRGEAGNPTPFNEHRQHLLTSRVWDQGREGLPVWVKENGERRRWGFRGGAG